MASWTFAPGPAAERGIVLRATTGDLINVLCGIIAVAAVLGVIKGRFGGAAKVALLVAAAIAVFLLQVFDAKFWGVVVMGGAVVILFFLPWLDHSPVKSIRYRPSWHKYVYGVFVIFFAPEAGGYFLEYNNFIPADPLKTPLHIAPVWYFTPYYSMLRAITTEMVYALIACVVLAAAFAVIKGRMPAVLKGVVAVAAAVGVVLMLSIDAKFWGVVVMGGAVVILFFLPWLDCSPVKSIRYRPSWHKYVYAVFVVNFFILAYLGVQPPSPVGERVSQVGTLFYFGFFLLMPWWSRLGEPKPVPDRVTFAAH